MARMDCPLSSPSWPRYTPIGRGSRGQLCLPCGALAATRIDLASMQLASVATCATACRSRSVTTRYARAAGSLGAQDRQTSGGGARSKARLMWGCSRRHPERQLPADMPDEVQSQWREWTAHYRRPHGLGTRQSAVAVEAGCACHAVLWQLLQGKWRCRAHRSGSGFDAGHSAITRADSSCG